MFDSRTLASMLRFNRVGSLLVAVVLIFVLHTALGPSSISESASPPASDMAPSAAVVHQQQQPRSLDRPQEVLAVPQESLEHPLRTANQDVDFEHLDISTEGFVTYDPSQTAHPIQLLIDRGKQHWAQIKSRIDKVRYLDDATADYEAAYKMKPPLGFDKWFQYVQSNDGVKAASLYPMAQLPFVQYLSISGKELRKRIKAQNEKPMMYTLTFVPDGQGDQGTQCDEDGQWFPEDGKTRGRGRVKVSGPLAWSWRCNNTLNLMLPILPKFPDDFFNRDPPLEMLFNTDDGPRSMVTHDFRERAEVYGASGKTWPDAQLKAAELAMEHTHGWQWVCPMDSPLKQQTVTQVLNEDTTKLRKASDRTFVADQYKSMDVCYNPEIRDLHSAALDDHFLSNGPLTPSISVSRTLRHSDITMVPLDAQYQDVAKIKWSSKKDARVFWRGSTTGVSQSNGHQWRKSQRQRLHWFANNHTEANVPVLIERPGKGVVTEEFPLQQMNEKWFDIGLAGGPHQCSVADGTCEEVRQAVDWKDPVRGPEALMYKYVVDVDGNAWSSRFRRLLKGNNVVLKSTMYPEWFSDLLVPWYHYVPIRFDYKDMHDIMAFFTGAPDGSTEGRDDLANDIAEQAHQFINQHWRVEDMRSYVMLVFLEYFRIFQDDRKGASLGGGR